MNSQARDEQVRALYEAALTLPVAERAPFVAAKSAGDAELRASVELLLSRRTATDFGGARQAEDETTELPAGTSIGNYKIDAVIGRGGMGVVYRATDTKLRRPVAIKFLWAALADAQARRRFEQEAETASGLNHPHIVTVHDVGEHGGAQYIVSELVDGGTLGDWAVRQRTWRQSVELLTGVADAIAAAHAAGVLHRDIKPGNILIGANGYAKLADFGLAKLADRGQSDAGCSPRTSVGVVIGTVAYMSPEQAAGQPVDARSDVFSFGAVLYELLSGRRPFEGATDLEVLKGIVHAEPAPLPSGVPDALRTIVDKALEKDPAERYQHMQDLVVDLKRVARKASGTSSQPALAAAAPKARRVHAWLVAAGLAVALVALAVPAALYLLRMPGSHAEGTPVVARLEVNLPAGVELFTSTNKTVALSPDGARLAFIGVLGGSRRIYLRTLDRFEAVPLRGTDAATACFFSPDGTLIGFITAGGVVSAVSLDNGLVETVTPQADFLNGATWTDHDRIVFVRDGALWQASRSSGMATALTELGGPHSDTFHAYPAALPDGNTILFSAQSGEDWRIESLVLATGERSTVIERATQPLYAGGHLLFYRDGELLVAPFDPARLELTGRAVQALAPENPAGPAGALVVPIVAVSSSGTVAYTRTTAVSRLVWVSRQGAEEPLNDVLRSYWNPRLAPEGGRVMVQAGDLWIHDIARATFTRLVSKDPGTYAFPLWTPDGRRIVHRTSNGLRVLEADGSGRSRSLAGTDGGDFPNAVSPDGETLVFSRSAREGSYTMDIYALSLRDAADIRPIVQTAAYDGGAQLSPDGHWMTYVSNESGQNEVYLRPFPGPDRRWQVSTQGGTQAVWNPNGNEIFYRNGNDMMAVEVSTAPDVKLAPPRLLFEQRYAFGTGITVPNYDVARDGQRFLMVKNESTAERLSVVLNWFSELER